MKSNLIRALEFLTGDEIDHRGQENDHGGNEHHHPIVIHSLLVRQRKRTTKRIGIAASHIHRQRIKPPVVAAQRPPGRVGRKHNVQADNRADEDRKADESHGRHQHRPLELPPGSVFFPEALVLALGHERLAKRVADYLHLKSVAVRQNPNGSNGCKSRRSC